MTTDATSTGEGPEDLRRIESLVPLLYDEMRSLARRHLDGERSDHTLAPTALVHEMYVKMAQGNGSAFQSRAEFFGAAARAMRQILIDHARTRGTTKRDPGRPRITLHESLHAGRIEASSVLALDEVLQRLAAVDQRKARMVELRFFAGLSIEEIADVLGVSHMTVSNDWRAARAWLSRELDPDS